MNMIRNNVQLVGILGQNPEIKNFDSGKKVANFSIACNETHTDAEGKKLKPHNGSEQLPGKALQQLPKNTW